MKKLICGGVLLAAGLWAQAPSVRAVNNAASYGAEIAQGSIFVVFGSNMGPAALTQAGSLPLGTTLSGTGVRFTPVAGGAGVDAFMVYTSAGQVAGILPSTAPVGEHNVTVSFNGAASAPLRVRVAQRAYGMITLNSAGSGLAVIQNASEGNRVMQFTAPARPGQVMVLWGTGLGPVTVPDNQVPGVQDLRGAANVRVIVGGVEVEPVYAGRSPGSPGADQINFTVPANAPTGCSVPLQVRVGNQLSPTTTIAIAPGGRAVCQHPVFSDDTLRRIDSGGNVSIGYFGLTSFNTSFAVPVLGNINLKFESADGAFQRLTLGNFDQVTGDVAPQLGACVVTPQQFDQSGQEIEPPPVQALDAGNLTLNGPNVANRAFEKRQNFYNLVLSDLSGGLSGILGGGAAPGIAPGTYTIAGGGGPDVGPFSASVRLSGLPTWTNRDAITAVNRSQNLTINWSGAAADDIVAVLGVAGNLVGGTDGTYRGAGFVCTARGNANSLTVPSSILQQLPAVAAVDPLSASAPNAIGVLSVSVTNGEGTNGRFTAPLRSGGNIDYGFFIYSFGGLKTLAYQ
jgi:uncharacterized protein (TIGR03437 family)